MKNKESENILDRKENQVRKVLMTYIYYIMKAMIFKRLLKLSSKEEKKIVTMNEKKFQQRNRNKQNNSMRTLDLKNPMKETFLKTLKELNDRADEQQKQS